MRKLCLIMMLAGLVGCGDATQTGTQPGKITGGTSGDGAKSATTSPAGDAARGRKISEERNCFGVCHKAGNFMNAPLLEDSIPARVKALENYPAYAEQLKKGDAARYQASAATIDAIASATDADERLRLWLATYLGNTTFDDAKYIMPAVKPALSAEETTHVVAYLMTLR